jgi:hypothetical protein
MKPRDITRDVQATLKKFGWTPEMLLGAGGHMLRRSHLREVEEQGGIEAAQASAGHRNADTTYEYTGNSRGKKRLDGVMRGWGGKSPDPEPEVKVPPQGVPLPLWRRLRRLLICSHGNGSHSR